MFCHKNARIKTKKRIIKYRSYKYFDNDKYMYDLSMIPFNIAEICYDIDDSYWVYETLVKDVIMNMLL